MANICKFEIRAKGSKEELEKFKKALCDYDGNDKEFVGIRTDIYGYSLVDDILEVGGSCDWAVCSCFDGSTYSNAKEDETVLSINEAAKKYNLAIEIWSYEDGCEFYEHYVIDQNGTYIINKEGKYRNYDIEWGEHGKNDEGYRQDILDAIYKSEKPISEEQIKKLITDYIEYEKLPWPEQRKIGYEFEDSFCEIDGNFYRTIQDFIKWQYVK